MDLEAEERWGLLIKDRLTSIRLLLDVVKAMLLTERHASTTNLLVTAADVGLKNEYRREMQGIARAGNVSYRDVLMANLYYEISGVLGTDLPTDNRSSALLHRDPAPPSLPSAAMAQCCWHTTRTTLLPSASSRFTPFSLSKARSCTRAQCSLARLGLPQHRGTTARPAGGLCP